MKPSERIEELAVQALVKEGFGHRDDPPDSVVVAGTIQGILDYLDEQNAAECPTCGSDDPDVFAEGFRIGPDYCPNPWHGPDPFHAAANDLPRTS